ncbi:protein kinase domain-containing protein [Prosthecodimorpha staleyi]|uniref:Protein kinase domain-containing protein n=1 Tax=Prosthecodimorpha staleyi TaxID=2840188 RepID=A0A947D8Q1_9HYPH|nr:hypothetical protein [Prosthecodimorpha staleyi]MBT9292765.1 hypothetical protein [Prosthecodimorpha staleyi]
MPIVGGNLVVTSQTTLTELQSYLKDHTAQGDKILGKVDKATGNTILYVGGKTTLGDTISGKAERRKETAKLTFDRLLEEAVKSDMAALGKDARVSLKGLAENIGTARESTGKHSMRSAQMERLATAYVNRSTAEHGRAATVQGGPKLADLGNFGSTIQVAVGHFQQALASGKDLTPYAEALGDALATAWLAGHDTPDERVLFAASNGKGLRNEIRDMMQTLIGGDAGLAFAHDDRVETALAKTFNRAAGKMLPDGEVAGTSTPIRGPGSKNNDLPNIRIGGQEYKPVGYIAEGGFARVFRYAPVSGQGNEIAYKRPEPGSLKGKSETARLEVLDNQTKASGEELLNHLAAQGNGHENVVELLGTTRNSDGQLGFAMEILPHGTVLDFAGELAGAVGTGPGKIDKSLADVLRLTLVQDLAEGMAHVQDTNGVIDLDFKSPNAMIGENGVGKVIDLGAARRGNTVTLNEVDMPDNPMWLAPEILKGKNELGELEKPMGLLKKVEDWTSSVVHGMFPKLQKGTAMSIGGNILSPDTARESARIKGEKSNLQVGGAVNVWALGMVAADLFSGEMWGSQYSFMSDAQDALADFGKNPNNVAVAQKLPDGTLPPGALRESSGNPSVDTFLNQLLAPVPGTRPTLTQVTNHQIFQGRGIGSQEARDLIVALKSGDPTQIDLAKANLDRVVNPPPPNRPLPQTPNVLPNMPPLPDVPGGTG